MSTPVAIKLYDLISAARAGKLQDVVERSTELSRLTPHPAPPPTHHHVVLVANPGTGKSSLIEALGLRLHQGHYRPLPAKLYRLNTEPIMSLLVNGDSLRACLAALRQATTGLDNRHPRRRGHPASGQRRPGPPRAHPGAPPSPHGPHQYPAHCHHHQHRLPTHLSKRLRL